MSKIGLESLVGVVQQQQRNPGVLTTMMMKATKESLLMWQECLLILSEDSFDLPLHHQSALAFGSVVRVSFWLHGPDP
jgi:hypothetical protein